MTIADVKEKELSDDYPVYPGYVYVVDEVVRVSEIQGTVMQLKQYLGAKTVKNCDIFGRGLA